MRALIEGSPPIEKAKSRVRKLLYLIEMHTGLRPEDFGSYGFGRSLLLKSSVVGPLLEELFGDELFDTKE